MAQAITAIHKQEQTFADIQNQALTDLNDSMAANAEAIQAFIKCISLLHSRGLLEIVNAMLEQGEGVLKVIVDQAKKPEYAVGLKNMMALVQLLGNLDVAALQNMLGALNMASEQVKENQVEPVTGVFNMLGKLRDPDVANGLGFMLEMLKAMGGQLSQGDSH